MRLMSFFLTPGELVRGEKAETRRDGWHKAPPRVGEEIRAVYKSQGLGKGGHPFELAVIRVREFRREPLGAITAAAVRAEGFPGWSPAMFVARFCKSQNKGRKKDELVHPWTDISVIEFELLSVTLAGYRAFKDTRAVHQLALRAA